MAGAIQDNLFIGKRAQELRGLLKIQYPMEHGVVTDWDDMERIWNWVYNDGLKALSEEVSGRTLSCVYVHVSNIPSTPCS
jgi:centractin